ncbi:hypothetical protein DFH09DRAFT_89216 [Mycena vulgaris]|nr:hypothetical protein DFH09DRAFT_89216 [Mycena vulgaris]
MSLAFLIMPFVGVLIRYRANYSPKTGEVHLGGEDGPASSSSDSISYFGMMKRVHRVEGWAGFCKGILPSIITTGLVFFLAEAIFTVFFSHPIRLLVDPGRILIFIGFAMRIIPALLLVPMTIITNRAIITPHKLAALDARAALRVLLSPVERAHSLRLYRAPGVALTLVLEALVGPTLGHLCLAALRLPLGLVIGAALPVIVLATALLTPLQVILVRLTLQRLGPDALVPDDAPPVYAGQTVDIRTQSTPYKGLFDCGCKIVDEEGAHVLFRAWWFTLLAMVIPLLVTLLLLPTD